MNCRKSLDKIPHLTSNLLLHCLVKIECSTVQIYSTLFNANVMLFISLSIMFLTYLLTYLLIVDQVLTDVERSNLLSDVLSLSRAGLLSYDISLDLTLYLRHETDLLPWDTVVSAFNYITRQLYRDPDFALWQVRHIINYIRGIRRSRRCELVGALLLGSFVHDACCDFSKSEVRFFNRQ